MQKNLVIVESPAKAKTIEKFLGKDFKVLSSFGHIRDLKKKDFGVNLTTFEPEYEIPADKTRVVSELRAQAKKAEAVWLASDEDREGEAIAWHLAEVLKLDPKNSRRIVFHEITKPAILAAIENPRSIDLNLVDAQQARRVLDRLVGFKLSPVLWRKVRPKLSAGRVQSVAVRLIVEREREIESFNAEASYRVSALFSVPTTNGSTAQLRATLGTRFKTQAEAEDFLNHCRTARFTISAVNTQPTRRTPAPPFTTSTLQQEAARKLGFPVATTMRVAQNLYEAGHITYMRTDSMNLSTLCLNSCDTVIADRMGKAYHQRRQYHTNSKGAQEAHEAIRPTDMTADTISGTSQEQRLYQLIWKRTIACQMADAQLEKTTVSIDVEGRDEQFGTVGEVVKFDGFLKVYREGHDNETDNEAEGRLLPPMKVGTDVSRIEMAAAERYSQPPLRYTEAALVHKLEELGIGRPSTYAPTISTIQQREYVIKGDKEGTQRSYTVLTLTDDTIAHETHTEVVGNEKNKLLPTDIGTVVNDFLQANFPDIMDFHFTANVEKEFDEIAEGDKHWTELIRSFYADFDPQVEKTMAEHTEHRVGERELGKDPATGEPVMVKIGRFGPMVQIGLPGNENKPRFATLAPGQSIATITLEEALELFRLPRTVGEFEGLPVVVNIGRFGPYVQHNKKFTSIPEDEDPMSVTLERAVELIEAKRKEEAARLIKQFAEDADLQIINGRYGAYISYRQKNYKLPKELLADAAAVTYEQCMQIVQEQDKAPKTTTRRKKK